MFAGEHGVATLLQPRRSGEVEKQREGFAGDPVLAVVDVEVTDGQRHVAAAVGILGEKFSQMLPGDLVVMAIQRRPGGRDGGICTHSPDPNAADGPTV